MNCALFVAKGCVVQKLCCPKVKKVMLGGVLRGGRRLPLTYSFDSSHTNLIEAWRHQCWSAPKDRLAFHLFLIEIEQQKTWKMARFECLQDRAIWHMSHTGAWWILRFQPYKPNRSLTTSMLRCFSFQFKEKKRACEMQSLGPQAPNGKQRDEFCDCRAPLFREDASWQP